MTVVAFVPCLVALVMALIYLYAKPPQAKQLALVAFGCAFLVAMFGLAGHTVRIP